MSLERTAGAVELAAETVFTFDNSFRVATIAKWAIIVTFVL